jgi:hypothetical protein
MALAPSIKMGREQGDGALPSPPPIPEGRSWQMRALIIGMGALDGMIIARTISTGVASMDGLKRNI